MNLEQLADAELQIAEQERAIETRQGEIQQLRARINDLTRQRQDIIARRQAGETREGDALDYDMLGTWIDQLRQHVQDDETALVGDRADVDKAKNLLAHHRQQIEHDALVEQHRAMTQRVREIEQAFLDGLAALVGLGERIGKPRLALNWQPSNDLHRAVHFQVVPPARQRQQQDRAEPRQAGPRQAA